jgi:hypothetical protein
MSAPSATRTCGSPPRRPTAHTSSMQAVSSESNMFHHGMNVTLFFVYGGVISISTRARICKLLRSPGIDFVSVLSLVGRYDNPIPTQFLASIDCSTIPAQFSGLLNFFLGWRAPRTNFPQVGL